MLCLNSVAGFSLVDPLPLSLVKPVVCCRSTTDGAVIAHTWCYPLKKEKTAHGAELFSHGGRKNLWGNYWNKHETPELLTGTVHFSVGSAAQSQIFGIDCFYRSWWGRSARLLAGGGNHYGFKNYYNRRQLKAVWKNRRIFSTDQNLPASRQALSQWFGLSVFPVFFWFTVIIAQ